MYRPAHFREDDLTVLHAWIRDYGFAVLTSSSPDGLVATHVPLLLDGECLIGHMARANPHWRAFDGATEALAVFSGPHAYISPTWYATTPKVPTWNYIAVHVHGKPRVIEEKREALEQLVAQYERVDGWSMDSLPGDYLSGHLNGIVAFEIPIERIVGKRKLNQNLTPDDIAGAIRGLRTAGADAVADMMEE